MEPEVSMIRSQKVTNDIWVSGPMLAQWHTQFNQFVALLVFSFID